jgi:septum formation protein
MSAPLILASGSEIRQALLRNAAVPFQAMPVEIDEAGIRERLIARDATPQQIADHLAEAKASEVAKTQPGALILGCDQVLDFQGQVLGKPRTLEEARHQLDMLNGNTHRLLSAAVLFQDGGRVWNHVGVVTLTMRRASGAYLDDYLTRNWDSIRHSVGGYKLEEEGVRLFDRVDGDYFNVLGLPLLELLAHLTGKGVLPG